MVFRDTLNNSLKYRHSITVGFVGQGESEMPEVVVAALYEINELNKVGEYLRHVMGSFGVLNSTKAIVALCLALWIRSKELELS